MLQNNIITKASVIEPKVPFLDINEIFYGAKRHFLEAEDWVSTSVVLGRSAGYSLSESITADQLVTWYQALEQQYPTGIIPNATFTMESRQRLLTWDQGIEKENPTGVMPKAIIENWQLLVGIGLTKKIYFYILKYFFILSLFSVK